MRICKKCQTAKTADQFYRHPKSRDGLSTNCKECTKRYAADRRTGEDAETIRERDRIRDRVPARAAAIRECITRARQADPARFAAYSREWARRNPEKRAAHVAVGNAVRDGKLVKGVCEKCGNPRVQAHHDDYSKPLEVRWLCHKHRGETRLT